VANTNFIVFGLTYHGLNPRSTALNSILTIIPGLIKMSAFDWSMTRWYKTHATGW
jgi:hypothetical protein